MFKIAGPIGRRHLRRHFAAVPETVIDGCFKLRSSVQELNDKFRGPLSKTTQANTALPFVFLLGNHSSGKSSFVNYILQRKTQTAGVAPTDDSFTVIAPGPSDVDRDGPAFIGDPDMGFSGLRTFGPTLVHHTELKIRSNTAVNNFMLVDSPGMIDSPKARHSDMSTSTKSRQQQAIMDRGYDFEKVCRWYAERADVILLFFDPDKPGTTGETLSILTNSLVGLENKLHIILNKADQFEKIHDFARAYGSLCWNLSKVIHRKDLPRIYTMCLPPAYQATHPGHNPNGSTEKRSLGQGLVDLEVTREEVVREVFNAPKRRVDNEITRLTDSVQLLLMHCKLVDDIVSRYRQSQLQHWGVVSGVGLSAMVVAPLLEYGVMSGELLGSPGGEVAWSMVIGTGAVGAVATLAGVLYTMQSLSSIGRKLFTEQELTMAYMRLYARQIAEEDEFTVTLWSRVRAHLLLGAGSTFYSTNGSGQAYSSNSTIDLTQLPRVKAADFKSLMNILETDIPVLRRVTAPAVYSYNGTHEPNNTAK